MERIGEYEVRRLIGEGGMGKVYEAEERLSGRKVALKVLRAELSRSESGRKLFMNEMRILANLEHPGIVRSLASFEEGDDLVLVLELLAGGTLRARLAEGPLSWEEAVAVALRVTSALHAAHEQDPPIIHRDLKPDNIMLVGELFEEDAVREGAVKVMDFGIAKVVQELTQTHTQSVGTLQYMSPEQVDARPVDARSDLYSLGLVIYEMLTGAPPFSSPSPRELLNLQCTAKPPGLDPTLRDGLPDGLEPLMLRLLSKDPEDRPDSTAEVEKRLRRILERADLSVLGAKSKPAKPTPATSEPAGDDADESTEDEDAETATETADAAPSGRVDTRHLVSGGEIAKKDKTATAKPERSGGGTTQMLIVAGVAFALGALVLFLIDPLGGKRDGDEASKPETEGTAVVTPAGTVGTTLAPLLPEVEPPDPETFVTDTSLSETLAAPDGAVLQLIRAGSFILGSNPPEGEPDEQPQRTIGLSDYYIDTTEVTVSAYQKCVAEGACNATHFSPGTESASCNFGVTGRDNHPMNCVSSDGAEAFCGWRDGRDARHRYRIPTEAEWEKAARGSDGRNFPWGSQVTTCSLALIGGCAGSTTAAVATNPSDISPSGVMDLGGRVSEWVLAVYDRPLDESLVAVPNAITRNLRGGNWRNRSPVRAADRDAEPVPLGFGTDNVGFRCVATPQ